MKLYYFKFDSKAGMDALISENPKAYPIGTLGVDKSTGKVYVAVGSPVAWDLIGGQA